jgi:hypothetical protein
VQAVQAGFRSVIALVAAVSAGVIGAGGLALSTAHPADAAVPPSAAAAAAWLEGQLSANDDSMPGFSPGSRDIGLTEDTVLALTSAGDGEDAVTRSATAQIAAHVTDFVSFDNFGVPDVHIAGALAKTLLVVEVQGADGHAFGGRDIEAELRATMATSGADTGRFEDQNAGSDSSNGFAQALAVLALVRSSGGVPADALSFLLAQQCPDGGFRLSYDTGASCTSNADDDADSTGLAVQALSALPTSATVTAAQTKAVAWLKSAQDSATGSFSNSVPGQPQANTNSTGLATSALRLGGEGAAADQGQAYIESAQLTSGANAGAIAFDPATKAGVSNGAIGANDLDQWRRATAQAVLGLGLPGYGQIDAVPTAPTSSTTSSTSRTSSSSSSSSTSRSSSTHSHSTGAAPTGAPSVLGERVANASADPGSLAATGGVPTHLVLFALVVLAAGIGVTVAATDRRAKHR